MRPMCAAQRDFPRYRNWKIVGFILILLHAVCLPVAWAEEPTPEFLIRQVINTYRSLDTYRVVGRTDTKGTLFYSGGKPRQWTGQFTILLKKPNLYRITWEWDPPYHWESQGASWNAGSQAYNYRQIPNRYMDIPTDLLNLRTGSAVSSKVTTVIPELFFAFFPENGINISKLKDLVVKGRKEIEGELCYVLEGRDQYMVVTYWISAHSYFIRRYALHADTSSGTEIDIEETEEETKAYLRSQGLEPTKERIESRQTVLHFNAKYLRESRGQATATHYFSHIATPIVNSEDLEFVIPEGVPFTKNMYKISQSTIDEFKASIDVLRK